MILAACDSELIERTFNEGELSITVYREFYGGVLVDEEGLKRHMKSASIINLVGERSIAIAEESGWIESQNILNICGVKHAQAAIIFDKATGKD